MLQRCASLPAEIRGTAAKRRGVLVKRPKPNQELRIDLPTVGVETVRKADIAGLAGIAIEAGKALVMNRQETAALADEPACSSTGSRRQSWPEGRIERQHLSRRRRRSGDALGADVIDALRAEQARCPHLRRRWREDAPGGASDVDLSGLAVWDLIDGVKATAGSRAGGEGGLLM